MKLLFDQNISHRIIPAISEKYPGSSSVRNEGLMNLSDRQIWDFAKNQNYSIVTQDSDFNDLNVLLGYPPKIIWVRAGNLRTDDLVAILIQNFDEISNFIVNQDFGCFEIYRLRAQ